MNQSTNYQGQPTQAASEASNATDPYAAYGGYQNYVAMWYAAQMAQGQQAAGQTQNQGQTGPT
jgi:far upstream element-binding protein